MRPGVVAPGSTIGIVGGGQLGRMVALAAARLGYRCHVYAPERDCPAGEVAARHVAASYEDGDALARFAADVDVVTVEFEHVPEGFVRRLAERVMVRPGVEVWEVCRDRLREKHLLRSLGIPLAPFASLAEGVDEEALRRRLGSRLFVKSRFSGYDGKGQQVVEEGESIAAAWDRLGRVPAVVEGGVDFACELSVITARGVDGCMRSFEPTENRHEGGILRSSRVPAAVEPGVREGAVGLAEGLAAALGAVGLLAVEMFVTPEGGLVVNELAPRPHNSGHWTLDAAVTSQFEQLVRAICGLPLGDAGRCRDAVMGNLLGAEVERALDLLAHPGVRVHLYGKREVRPGRKMGHWTRLVPPGGFAGPSGG